jgi:hypothetical protein
MIETLLEVTTTTGVCPVVPETFGIPGVVMNTVDTDDVPPLNPGKLTLGGNVPPG